MAVITETKEIGEHEYSVTQWNAQKALLMKLKLTKVLGPSLAELSKGIDLTGKKKMSEKEQVAAFGTALEKLFEMAEPEDILELITECIVGVAMDNERLTKTTINERFNGGDLMDIYKLFFFVLKVNYSGFMKGQLVENLLAKVGGQL